MKFRGGNDLIITHPAVLTGLSFVPITTLILLFCGHQGRITDHRVSVTEHGMDKMLAGEILETFLQARI